MNRCFLLGRLTKDPVIRHTQDQKAVASFTLAVNRASARQEQKADFINCTAWEKRAEFAEKYLHQGSKIALSGRIQTGSYKDRDGKTVYTTDVVVEEMEFAESKPSSSQAAPDTGETDFVPIPEGLQEQLPFV